MIGYFPVSTPNFLNDRNQLDWIGSPSSTMNK
jgi:hypothetical protein